MDVFQPEPGNQLPLNLLSEVLWSKDTPTNTSREFIQAKFDAALGQLGSVEQWEGSQLLDAFTKLPLAARLAFTNILGALEGSEIDQNLIAEIKEMRQCPGPDAASLVQADSHLYEGQELLGNICTSWNSLSSASRQVLAAAMMNIAGVEMTQLNQIMIAHRQRESKQG